jgi:hypothetical protein
MGKSTLGLDAVINVALTGKPAAWFSPTYKMLADVWRDAKRLLQPVTLRVNEQEKRIELLTRGVIDFWRRRWSLTLRPRGRKRYARRSPTTRAARGS